MEKGSREGRNHRPYRLEWKHEALKRLKRLPRDRQQQVRIKFEALVDDPTGSQPQAKPFKGQPGAFRLRIGEWRATYELDHAQRLVTVLRIEPGHDVY